MKDTLSVIGFIGLLTVAAFWLLYDDKDRYIGMVAKIKRFFKTKGK